MNLLLLSFQEKKSIVPEEETLDDLREAVALGLEILDEYYDKVDVTVSDSEGEEEDIPRYQQPGYMLQVQSKLKIQMF